VAVDTSPVLILVASSTAPAAVKNVAEYVCDGTADQTEINLALAAVASTGGLVQLTPGTFNLSATITPTVGNIILRGSGWGTILRVNNAANVYAITFAPSGGNWFHGAALEDFKIECNGANQTTAGGGIDAFGAVWCKFDHLWIHQPWGNGLFLHQDNLGGFGHHNEVTGCFFERGDQSNGGDGRALRLDQCDECYIAHNTFQDNGRSGASERNHIYDLAGLNFFHHNSFVGGGTGLKLQGPDSLADGNIFDGCKDHSIRVNGARCQVLNNKLYHLGFTGTNLDGIHVDNVADTQILDNLFDTIATVDALGGTARSAINLSVGPATNSIIGQNRILATGMAYGTGAVIPGAGTGHLFRDNKGWTTENRGTATVASGTTSIAVSHGLSMTPSSSGIQISPINDPTTTVDWWFDTVTATQFTIRTSANPGTSGYSFAWQAQVL
jgi:hypothetical protein